MARLSRHVRLIYLVALFQLLGGPAVLCGVIGLARLASDRQLTLAEHAARAVQRAEGREVADPAAKTRKEMSVAVESSDSGQPAQTPPPEEWKPKLNGILHSFYRPFIGSAFESGKRYAWHVPLFAGPPQEPPVPPPRAGVS